MKIPDLAHIELINWSRYCWEGSYPHPLPPSHCFSFEHNYLAPSDMGNEDVPEPRILANSHNARRVQRIYDALPIMQRKVLCAEYPKRHESGRVEYGMQGAAKRLGITLSEYEYSLSDAASKIMEEFA